jgi:4-hydroxybenzoate polyprenyltransferase
LQIGVHARQPAQISRRGGLLTDRRRPPGLSLQSIIAIEEVRKISGSIRATMNTSQSSQTTQKAKSASTRQNLFARLWQYQSERFPVFAHGILIAAFSFSGVCLSAILRGSEQLPSAATLFVAFACALAFFFQLRVADEHKDAEEDRLHRPYRPVPRGLVTLKELRAAAILTAVAQFVSCLALKPLLIPLLLAAWLYLALMTKEFFIGEYLRKHPVIYMTSHMLILPIVDYFITACDWLPGAPPHGLLWFLAVSFFNGLVIEIGRKLRSPGEEEFGVETYSSLWGLKTAALVWIVIMITTTILATITACHYGFGAVTAGILVLLLLVNCLIGSRTANQPPVKTSAQFENLSAAWTLVLYLSIGTVPMLLTLWR